MTPAETLALLAPEAAADPNASQYLTLAEGRTSAAFFGARYSEAVALRAAHTWAVSKRNPSEAGAMTARRLGPASVSFQAPAGGGSSLELTTYGRELLALTRECGPGAAVLGALPC